MTTRAKHTPGPWGIHSPRNPQLVGDDRGLVADCESLSREAEEDIANARLIAAAPEMAEALASCLPIMAAQLRLAKKNEEYYARQKAQCRWDFSSGAAERESEKAARCQDMAALYRDLAAALDDGCEEIHAVLQKAGVLDDSNGEEME